MSRRDMGAGIYLLVAGGGTAGHLLPGIAVADVLRSRGHPARSIRFLGARRGPEAKTVPEAGYEVDLLPGRGIQRRISIENLRSMWGLIRSAAMAWNLVRVTRPRVVLVLGGFASAAGALAAVLWRVPMVVAEQNARAGAVSRIASHFAKACAVPFTSTDLPKAVLTGNPVRSAVLTAGASRDPRRSRVALGLPADRTLVAVFAGSLGARRLNEATCEAVQDHWAERGDLAVYHVFGARDWDDRPAVARSASDTPQGEGGLFYRAVRYEEHMELVLDAADLVVCRAGGTTVAELAVIGTPAVLVPLPIATRDHQRFNALELTRVGAAVLVPDAELDATRLVGEVANLTDDPERLAAMAGAACALGRPDAAEAVADLLERSARPERNAHPERSFHSERDVRG